MGNQKYSIEILSHTVSMSKANYVKNRVMGQEQLLTEYIKLASKVIAEELLKRGAFEIRNYNDFATDAINIQLDIQFLKKIDN